MIWGLTDVCGDLVDASQTITNESVYFQAPAAHVVHDELQMAQLEIINQSLYFLPPLATTLRDGSDSLHNTCQKIIADSLYFPSSSDLEHLESNELRNAWERIIAESSYTFPPDVSISITDGSGDLFDAYENIRAESLYFHHDASLPPIPDVSSSDIQGELSDAYEEISAESLYFHPEPPILTLGADDASNVNVPGELSGAYEQIIVESVYFHPGISLFFSPDIPDDLRDAYRDIQIHSAYFSPLFASSSPPFASSSLFASPLSGSPEMISR